jgi:hypothetical protein
LAIYIREAHPKDGWWLGGGFIGRAIRLSGSKAAFDVYDPKTLDERKQVAERFQLALQYRIPILVDEIDDPVNKAYAALPTRLYLVDENGRIVYAGGLGPFGFKPAELKLEIDQLLGGDK